jgi:hypothetical protein
VPGWTVSVAGVYASAVDRTVVVAAVVCAGGDVANGAFDSGVVADVEVEGGCCCIGATADGAGCGA